MTKQLLTVALCVLVSQVSFATGISFSDTEGLRCTSRFNDLEINMKYGAALAEAEVLKNLKEPSQYLSLLQLIENAGSISSLGKLVIVDLDTVNWKEHRKIATLDDVKVVYFKIRDEGIEANVVFEAKLSSSGRINEPVLCHFNHLPYDGAAGN